MTCRSNIYRNIFTIINRLAGVWRLFLLVMVNLSLLLIAIGILLLIAGLALLICSLQYARSLGQPSSHLFSVESGRSPLPPPLKVRRKKDSSFPMTNNSPFETSERSEKKSEVDATPSQMINTSGNEPFLFDTPFLEADERRGDIDFLQLGAALIDRPFGMALQPLKGMGPTVMRMQINEQHWIRKDDV